MKIPQTMGYFAVNSLRVPSSALPTFPSVGIGGSSGEAAKADRFGKSTASDLRGRSRVPFDVPAFS
jgi:hypothetical protein